MDMLLKADIPWFAFTSLSGMAHCATAASEIARESRAARKKRNRSCGPESGASVPAHAMHDNEQSGGEVVALIKQGSRALSEEGCEGKDLVITPRKKRKHQSLSLLGKRREHRRECVWKTGQAESEKMVAPQKTSVCNTWTEQQPAL
jgi:hypothetical protein